MGRHRSSKNHNKSPSPSKTPQSTATPPSIGTPSSSIMVASSQLSPPVVNLNNKFQDQDLDLTKEEMLEVIKSLRNKVKSLTQRVTILKQTS